MGVKPKRSQRNILQGIHQSLHATIHKMIPHPCNSCPETVARLQSGQKSVFFFVNTMPPLSRQSSIAIHSQWDMEYSQHAIHSIGLCEGHEHLWVTMSVEHLLKFFCLPKSCTLTQLPDAASWRYKSFTCWNKLTDRSLKEKMKKKLKKPKPQHFSFRQSINTSTRTEQKNILLKQPSRSTGYLSQSVAAEEILAGEPQKQKFCCSTGSLQAAAAQALLRYSLMRTQTWIWTWDLQNSSPWAARAQETHISVFLPQIDGAVV